MAKEVDPRRFWGDRAAGVVIQRKSDGKILLLHRSNVEGGGWGFPGGKVDEEDDLATTIMHEMKEELGSIPKGRLTGKTWVYRTKMNIGDYRVDLDHEVTEDGQDFQYHFLHYVTTEKNWNPRLNWEHNQYKWCDRDKLPSGLYTAIDSDGSEVETVKIAIDKLAFKMTSLGEAARKLGLKNIVSEVTYMDEFSWTGRTKPPSFEKFWEAFSTTYDVQEEMKEDQVTEEEVRARIERVYSSVTREIKGLHNKPCYRLMTLPANFDFKNIKSVGNFWTSNRDKVWEHAHDAGPKYKPGDPRRDSNTPSVYVVLEGVIDLAAVDWYNTIAARTDYFIDHREEKEVNFGLDEEIMVKQIEVYKDRMGKPELIRIGKKIPVGKRTFVPMDESRNSPSRPVVTFDFDGVLHLGPIKLAHPDEEEDVPNPKMIRLFKRLSRTNDVYIVTARASYAKARVEDFVERQALPCKGIETTNGNDNKIKKVRELGSTMHYDDNAYVVDSLIASGLEAKLV